MLKKMVSLSKMLEVTNYSKRCIIITENKNTFSSRRNNYGKNYNGEN